MLHVREVNAREIKKMRVTGIVLLGFGSDYGSARDLGVIIDSRRTLSAHVAVLCQAGYYQLRQLRTSVSSALEALTMMRYINLRLHYITLRTLVQSSTAEAAETVPAAFISCRLDYCNSLLYGLPDTLLRKLQSVQNVTARLITGARRRGHNKPVLLELHWLPIRERVKFKLACLARQSLFGQPPYLTDGYCVVSGSTQRSLRSVDVSNLRSTTNTKQLRRQNICDRRSSSVAFSPGPAMQSRYFL